jgi:hypothetical protein
LKNAMAQASALLAEHLQWAIDQQLLKSK